MPLSTSNTDILIVGAGPSGLTLALTLAIALSSPTNPTPPPIRVIEKRQGSHLAQRGSGIQPRSLELFHALGVLPDIWAGSRWNVPSAMYDMSTDRGTERGRVIARVVDATPYVEPTPDVPFRTPRIIGQFHTEEILRTHLARHGVVVEMGSELVGFTQDEEGVTAEILTHTADGNAQEGTRKETIRAQYLVSAEGAKSTVRKQLGIPFVGETKDVMHLLLADVHVIGLSSGYWHQWGDMGSRTVRLRPTEDPGVFSLMVGGKDADIAALAVNRDALFQFVYEVTNRTPEELRFGEIRSMSEFRPNIRLAERYSEGRVFLVGDAAHVHSPTGGQGLNTGIQDSFNLGWKLSLVLKHQAPPSLLASYTAERRPVAQDVLSMTSSIMNKTVAYKSTSGDGTTTTTTNGGGDPAAFAHRPRALHQLGVNYRFSAIVVDEQPLPMLEAGNQGVAVSAAYKPEDPTVLRAGDRAPDAPGLVRVRGVRPQEARGSVVDYALDEQSTRLFDIFKPTRHTALVFLGGMGTTNVDDLREMLTALRECAPHDALHIAFVLPADYDHILRAFVSVLEGSDADVFVDTMGYAGTFYPPAVQGFPVIIVRPDGVIGAVVTGKEGIVRYLGGVFGLPGTL